MATQSMHGQDNLLKFKHSIRMGKKADLSDFERIQIIVMK